MARWQLKAQAKDQLRGRWGRFALYTLLMLVLAVFVNAEHCRSGFFLIEGNAFSRSLVTFWQFGNPFRMLLFIISRLLWGFFCFGYQEIFIKTRAGVPTGVDSLFRQFAVRPAKVIGVTLLYLAIEAVYMLLTNVLALLMPLVSVPLTIALAVLYCFVNLRLSMVPLILLENPYTTVPDAFIQSYNVMRGYTWQLFVLFLSFLGWIILGVFTAGIGYLWLVPYMMMTMVNFYYDIKARQLAAAGVDSCLGKSGNYPPE